MSITFDKRRKLFHLTGGNMSYIIQIHEAGYLMHLYWGKKINKPNPDNVIAHMQRCSFSPNPNPKDPILTLDDLPQEYPSYGSSDYRTPAFAVQHEDGSTVTELKYESHKIVKGKPKLEGMPAVYVEKESEAETLEITLRDVLTGLRVFLQYSVYEDFNAVSRSVRFENGGPTTMDLQRALSASVDFNTDEYDLLHLHGAWVRERHVERRPLITGTLAVESRRGASSHQSNPFIALMSKDATENHGDAYGFSLVYSGNFLAQAEVHQYRTARVSMGINPFDFSWRLEPGETFQTPECVMVYSGNGMGEMSRTYHTLYRTRLCRGRHRDLTRPVLANNWEATYFDFDEEKILDIAMAGSKLGMELFVLDDGWFGKRNNDASSLGDWQVDRNKLPKGMGHLADSINAIGMKFGLWFEPEMVSPDSGLYRAHPDWCLHVPGRNRTEGRNQLVLDFSRTDVCDYIIDSVSSILKSANIQYVKWDMNRSMTEIGSKLLPPERQRETTHRYILGLYRVMEKITAEFPDVLFESCSGGGGRFDPGMLHYMPQTWTSDCTDAVERLKIQYGTSMVYPLITMGAHVSAVPNHQIQRNTSLKLRGDVAMSGNFGYELDLTQLTAEERDEVKAQVERYKNIRELVQFGDFYRLESPFEGETCSWMVVSEDQSEAYFSYFRIHPVLNGRRERVKLRGLDAGKEYLVEELDLVIGGDELMHAGISIPELEGDYQSVSCKLSEK